MARNFYSRQIQRATGGSKGKVNFFFESKSPCHQTGSARGNALADFGVAVQPLKRGGKEVLEIKLSWWKKSVEELKQVYTELNYSKVGRRARIKKTEEDVVPS